MLCRRLKENIGTHEPGEGRALWETLAACAVLTTRTMETGTTIGTASWPLEWKLSPQQELDLLLEPQCHASATTSVTILLELIWARSLTQRLSWAKARITKQRQQSELHLRLIQNICESCECQKLLLQLQRVSNPVREAL